MNKRPVAALFLALFLMLPAASRAGELTGYDETVTLRPDGSALVRLVLTLPRNGGGEIVLPLSRGPLRDLVVLQPAAAAVRAFEDKGNFLLGLTIPAGAETPVTVEMTYSVDGCFQAGGEASAFGNRDLTYRFINTAFERIGTFKAALVLPAGYVVSAVSDYLPKARVEGGAYPYEIGRRSGLDVGRISADGLKLGDSVMLRMTFKSAKKSKPLFFVLLAVAGVYLTAFRGLLKNGKGKA